jgi:O-antigen/teichoic acid export membrane protein
MRHESNKISAAMISLGAASEVALPFVRSVALAHMISPEQFGLAITLALAAGISEVITDIGLNNSAMRQGDRSDDILPTLHSLLLIRATIIGLILIASGLPLAYLFGAPEAATSFSILGVAAIIRGFHHLEPMRVLRDFVYGPDAVSSAAEHVVWTGVTIAGAVVLNDYRCMLVGIIAGAIGYVVVSHLVSNERWRLGWSPDVAREAFSYGAPLLPNGIALALSSMGDRFLIGAFLGVAPLAYYNASSTAAFMPRGVVLRILGAVILPTFLRHGRDGVVTLRIVDFYGLFLSAISAWYSLTFLCFGPWAVGFVFGAQYGPDQVLVSCIALSVYLKFLMTLPHPPALVFGETKLILVSTILASLGLVCAGIAVLINPQLPAFVFGFAVGEFITVIWSIAISVKVYRFAPKLLWFGTLFPILVLAAAHAVCATTPVDDLVGRTEFFLIGSIILAGCYAVAWKWSGLPWLPEFARLLRGGSEDLAIQPQEKPL